MCAFHTIYILCMIVDTNVKKMCFELHVCANVGDMLEHSYTCERIIIICLFAYYNGMGVRCSALFSYICRQNTLICETADVDAHIALPFEWMNIQTVG